MNGGPQDVERIAAALARRFGRVVVIPRGDWEAALRAGGQPTRLPEPFPPHRGVQGNPGFEFAVASGLAFTADRGGVGGIHIVRRDEKDPPGERINVDSHEVIEDLTTRPLWQEVLRAAGLEDSEGLRTTCDGYVYAYARDRDDHHAPEVPEDIAAAKPKPTTEQVTAPRPPTVAAAHASPARPPETPVATAPAPPAPPETVPPPIAVATEVEPRPWPGINTIASVVAAIAAVVTIVLMLLDAAERRAADDEQRAISLRGVRIGESTLAVVRRDADRSAAAEDSVRRAKVASVEAARRADDDAAVEAERLRVNAVAIRDAELRLRFRLLREDLSAVSLVNPVRQESHAYYRATEAWHRFLRAREPRGAGIAGQTTRDLMESVYRLDHNNEEVRQALLNLHAILGRNDENLYAGVGTSWTPPDTMKMTVKDAVADRPPAKLPVDQVLRMLEIPRWAGR